MPLLTSLRELFGWGPPAPKAPTPPTIWSSKPIKFKYTPPPTLPPQAVIIPSSIQTTVAAAVSNQFGSPQAAASNAAALVTQLGNLTATAVYLMQCIEALTTTLGVQFNFSQNPDLGRALAQIYNTATPPTSMNMAMYVNLLQAEMSFLQFDLLNPPALSSVQIQPLQRANIVVASSAFEDALISSGVYDQTLPVLLRSLASDQVTFGVMTTALMTYPILSVPQLTPAQLAASQTPTDSSASPLNGSTVDVGDSLNAVLTTALNQTTASYAGIYNLVASPDPTETALPSVVSTLAAQPASNLTRLLSMLSNLIAFTQQPTIKQLANSADNILVPRLLSDTTSHAVNLDYVSQVAVTPSTSAGLTGTLGMLMSALASFNIGSILGVGITGAVATSAGGYNSAIPAPTQAAVTAGLPEGLQIMAANIAWSQNQHMSQQQLVQSSLQRLSLRKTSNQGDTTEMLTSMKSLSSAIGVIQSLLQAGSSTPSATGNTTSLGTSTPTPNASLTSFGTLISSLPSQSGSSYALDGNTLVITPPAIPTAPATVQATLKSGGVNQITTQALQVPITLGV